MTTSRVDNKGNRLTALQFTNCIDENEISDDALFDSGASEHVFNDIIGLKEAERVLAISVENMYGITVKSTQRCIVVVDVGGRRTMFCRLYHIQTVNVNLILCSGSDERDVTTNIPLGKCTLID